MARIRTIKPEFWTSEQVVACSPLARLMFLGVWNFCDDGGVHPLSWSRIKMEVFPGDACTQRDIESWFNELERENLVERFFADGKWWFFVTGWSHQYIQKPQFKYPKPSEREDYRTGIVPLSCQYRTGNGAVTEEYQGDVDVEVDTLTPLVASATARADVSEGDFFSSQSAYGESSLRAEGPAENAPPEASLATVAVTTPPEAQERNTRDPGAIPHVEKLDAVIAVWNELPIAMTHHRVDDPRGQAVVKGWRRAMKVPALRELLFDTTKISAAIRRAKFCHGDRASWFRFPKLFAQNRDGEWLLVKMLEGGFDGSGGAQQTTQTGIDWSKYDTE